MLLRADKSLPSPMTAGFFVISHPSFRGDAQHRTRNLEIPGLVLRTIPE
jgi:hypothetical protein